MNDSDKNELEDDDDDNFLLKPAKSDHPIYSGSSFISTSPRAVRDNQVREASEADDSDSSA